MVAYQFSLYIYLNAEHHRAPRSRHSTQADTHAAEVVVLIEQVVAGKTDPQVGLVDTEDLGDLRVPQPIARYFASVANGVFQHDVGGIGIGGTQVRTVFSRVVLWSA